MTDERLFEIKVRLEKASEYQELIDGKDPLLKFYVEDVTELVEAVEWWKLVGGCVRHINPDAGAICSVAEDNRRLRQQAKDNALTPFM